jgi:hypothetical protein
MKKLSCWFGRHTWQTTVEKGYTLTACSACGTLRRRGPGGPTGPLGGSTGGGGAI